MPPPRDQCSELLSLIQAFLLASNDWPSWPFLGCCGSHFAAAKKGPAAVDRARPKFHGDKRSPSRDWVHCTSGFCQDRLPILHPPSETVAFEGPKEWLKVLSKGSRGGFANQAGGTLRRRIERIRRVWLMGSPLTGRPAGVFGKFFR